MHARALARVLALALLLLAPAVAADETFHYAPDQALSLEPATLREPLSSGVSACAVACVRHVVENGHEYTLQAPGNGRPVESHFWIEVVAPTAGPPSVQPVLYACPLSLWVQVLAANGENKWYWSLCVGLDELGMASAPGVHEVDIEWPAGYSDAAFVAGDRLFASVWTASSSMPEAPTIYLLGDEDHPSSFLFSGYQGPQAEPVPPSTNETAPTTPKPRPDPKPTPDPKPQGNSTTSPPPEQPPEPVVEARQPTQPTSPKQEPAKASAMAVQALLVLLGVLAAARRRPA